MNIVSKWDALKTKLKCNIVLNTKSSKTAFHYVIFNVLFSCRSSSATASDHITFSVSTVKHKLFFNSTLICLDVVSKPVFERVPNEIRHCG
jgi:hypothetical protein